jgi:hypothetical protein
MGNIINSYFFAEQNGENFTVFMETNRNYGTYLCQWSVSLPPNNNRQMIKNMGKS